MQNSELLPAGSFCSNADCPDYGRSGSGHVVRYGFTRRGVQRYQCRTCGKTFTATCGSVFYGLRHDPQTVLECLALLAERNSQAALSRVKGVKEETIAAWLKRAAAHVEQIEPVLIGKYRVRRAQLDALWTFVGHKGEKGGGGKKLSAAAFGAARPSTATPG